VIATTDDDVEARRRELRRIARRAFHTLIAGLAFAMPLGCLGLGGLVALAFVAVAFVLAEELGRAWLPAAARIAAIVTSGVVALYGLAVAPSWVNGIVRGGPETAYEKMGEAARDPRLLLGALGVAMLVAIVALARALARNRLVIVVATASVCAPLGALLAAWSAGDSEIAAIHGALAAGILTIALAIGERGQPPAPRVENASSSLAIGTSLALCGIALAVFNVVGASFVEQAHARRRDIEVGLIMQGVARGQAEFHAARERYAKDLSELAAAGFFEADPRYAEAGTYVFETAPSSDGESFFIVANPTHDARPSYFTTDRTMKWPSRAPGPISIDPKLGPGLPAGAIPTAAQRMRECGTGRQFATTWFPFGDPSY
jgi:hypothetical protein